MKKSPTIINFFEKTKNCCQTFLSSCCDYDSRKTNSKPSILANLYQPMPKPEFTNPFVNILNQQRPEPKTILYPNGAIDNAEFLKKLKLQTTGLAPYKAPVPLSSLQIEKQKNAISKIIYNPELTPPPSPTLHLMEPSPEPIDPLKKDLENIVDMFAGFGLEGEIGKINALEELSEIEKDLINRSRSVGTSRSEARQLLKISTSQNTHHYQV
jgi:hypothetical protein